MGGEKGSRKGLANKAEKLRNGLVIRSLRVMSDF